MSSRSGRSRASPGAHVDCIFMGEETGGNTLATFVAKVRSSRALMSIVVPRKTTGEFVSKRVAAFMKELGCEMSVVTLKTDNELVLVAVADDVAKVRASQGAQWTIMVKSPAYSSKSDGVIERGVQTIQGMVRTLRSAIEEKWMVKLDPENALWTWLVEYAGWLVNRAEGPRRPDAIRTAEGQGAFVGDGVWRGRDVEEETSGRPARQVVLPLERRHLLGGEGQHG